MKSSVNKKTFSRKKRALIYIVSVITASFLLSLLLMFLVNDAFSLTSPSGTTEVVITEDIGLFKASKTLKEQGLIDSRIWFTVYSCLRGKHTPVKAGSYKISNTGGFDGILSTLDSGIK